MNLLALAYTCILALSTSNAHPNGNGHNNNHINAPDATKVIGTAIPTSPPVETPPTAGAPQTLPSGISWCGRHSDKLQINTLDIEPWPLVKGQDIVFKSSGKVLEKMNNGTIAQLLYDGYPFMTIDLCSQMSILTGLQCSDISVGPYYDLQFTFPYPSMLPDFPAAQIELLVLNAPNKNGNMHEFTCLKADVSIVGGTVNIENASAGGFEMSSTATLLASTAIASKTAPANDNVLSTEFIVHQTATETMTGEFSATKTASVTETASVGCGGGIIGNGQCEFDVCCSRFGYCGVNEDFCQASECVAGPCWVG